MLKRNLIAVTSLLVLLWATPALAAPPDHSRGGPDNRGGAEVRLTDVELKNEPTLTVSRDRDGDVRLTGNGAEATGSLTLTDQAKDALKLIVFDEIDLRITTTRGSTESVDGRVSGIIILDQDGEIFRVRWQGTASGEVTALDLRSGKFDFGNVHINGIAIDHVGAGLTDRGARSDLVFSVPLSVTISHDAQRNASGRRQ